MVPLTSSSRPLGSAGWQILVACAGFNLIAGLLILRDYDIALMHDWTSAWLHQSVELYDNGLRFVDYPPQGIVALAPIAMLPLGWSAVAWALLSIGLALTAPGIAARCVREDASREEITILTLTFLCWSGTRTVLQFTMLALVLSLLAWRHAVRRPWLAGALLGVAMMKPQVALPFTVWMIVSGSRRVMLSAAVTVAGLWGIYCVRAGTDPVTVVHGWLEAMRLIYTGPQPLTGFSELSSLLPSQHRDWLSPALVAVLFAPVILTGWWASRLNRTSTLTAIPGMAAAATLLAFRHMSLAFVTLLPAAAWLLLDGDAETRARRRPFFWALQAGMMFDLPTLERWLGFMHVSLGWLDVVMRHADRGLILGCLLTLLVLQRAASRQPAGTTIRTGNDTQPA